MTQDQDYKKFDTTHLTWAWVHNKKKHRIEWKMFKYIYVKRVFFVVYVALTNICLLLYQLVSSSFESILYEDGVAIVKHLFISFVVDLIWDMCRGIGININNLEQYYAFFELYTL